MIVNGSLLINAVVSNATAATLDTMGDRRSSPYCSASRSISFLIKRLSNNFDPKVFSRAARDY